MRSLIRALLALALTFGTTLSAAAQPSGPDGNLPLRADLLERRLRDDPFQIVEVGKTSGGIMDTAKVTLRFDDGFTAKAKWKQAPSGGDGWNNSPRREIAAYKAQQLFFEPEEYLVPPVVPRCIPLDTYRVFDPEPKSNLPHLPNARCVYGTLSAWMENVEPHEPRLDAERFSHDLSYACRFGTLNVFLYLIEHKDARSANLLISKDPGNPEIFSIDNGIAFGGTLYNFFMFHFDRIAVQGLPIEIVQKVRYAQPADLQRLGVIAELRLGPDGILRSVPPSANVDPSKGQRDLPDGMQFGLTTDEINGMISRRQELLDRVNRGEIGTFDCTPQPPHI
jgi:hypothetical protein